MFAPKARKDGYVIPAMDDEIKVRAVKKFLPKGPIVGGGHREYDIIQVWEVEGGLRTLNAEHVIDVR